MRPPDVLMPHSPPGAARPSSQYWAPRPYSAFPITSVPMAAMTVKQSWISATFTSAAFTPARSYALRMAQYAPAGRSTSRPSFFNGSVACAKPARRTQSCLFRPSLRRPSSVARIIAA